MFYAKSTCGFYSREIHGDNIPSDSVEITNEEHAALLDGQSEGKTISADLGGNPILIDPPEPTPAQIVAQYETALDNHLDSVAKLHRYDNRFTFALRAGYPGPYHAEAVSFAEWMDSCNVQAFALLQSVKDGEAAMPTVENFIAGLPAFAP